MTDLQERILIKSHELFMRFGIRSVSMDEIAAHLGISKKTIYQFYSDKDSLVGDAVGIEINSAEKQCRLHRSKSIDAVHEVFLAIDMMKEMFKMMNPAVMYDLEKYHPGAYQKFNEHKSRFMYDVVRQNIERGKKEGYFRQEINSDIMAKFRLASMFVIFSADIFPPSKYQLFDTSVEILENFLFGLTTAKGQKLIQKYKLQRQKQQDNDEKKHG